MSPQELAKEFAHIESTNLLAHTIRNIEDRIFNMTREGDTGYNYHISIRINEDVSKSCCLFAVRGCTIFLPKQASEDLSEEDVRILRLCLAHEIGHITFVRLRVKKIVQNLMDMCYKISSQPLVAQGDFGHESC